MTSFEIYESVCQENSPEKIPNILKTGRDLLSLEEMLVLLQNYGDQNKYGIDYEKNVYNKREMNGRNQKISVEESGLYVYPGLSMEMIHYLNDFTEISHQRQDLTKVSDEDRKRFGFRGRSGNNGEYLTREFSEKSYLSTGPTEWCLWSFDSRGKIRNRMIWQKDHRKIWACNALTPRVEEATIEWLQYLIINFLKPCGYQVEGSFVIKDISRKKVCFVKNNRINI